MCVGVRVCVCVDITRRYCIKTDKLRMMQTTPYHNHQGLLVFDAKDLGEIPSHPKWRKQMKMA